MGGSGYEPLQHSIPAVLGCLSLLTRAFVSTKPLCARISLFFLEKFLQEAPFRSEMIIAPMLIELRKILHKKISLFSGVDFNVNHSMGLNGFCDYIISYSTNQIYITNPVILLVEAKNENIKSGLPQCIAAMYSAKIYNEREHNDIHAILGVVTIGSNWKFIKLENTNVYIEYGEYLVNDAGKILAIMHHFIQSTPM